MKAVILCGGKGTRMKEETEYKPKPLVEVGDKPMIWHIMKIYSHYGINDFILCLGYKGYMLKQYFKDTLWINNDCTMQTSKSPSSIEYHTTDKNNEKWKVTLVDTGSNSLTATRLKKIQKYIDEEDFFMTYGDGLSNVNIRGLLDYHKRMGKTVTLTGIHPESSYGIIDVKDGLAKSFIEKPKTADTVNGGFMVMNKKVFNYIPEEDCMFEEAPMRKIAAAGELAVFNHEGFWTAIDTIKDIERVNNLWDKGERPWKVWE
ncbi:glucose-1-phosphate cytidylyltransferase [Clostridium swellfunianum]|uniref:glucose-1-phosphate cytidylyltransferase n=1 Tax=Clostridium swellfunianum TaxID=1367462 RepID=UPI0020309CE9|nr:glucose-1-phosphate cytidylyltransferase [Clostridium swellfunianum]